MPQQQGACHNNYMYDMREFTWESRSINLCPTGVCHRLCGRSFCPRGISSRFSAPGYKLEPSYFNENFSSEQLLTVGRPLRIDGLTRVVASW